MPTLIVALLTAVAVEVDHAEIQVFAPPSCTRAARTSFCGRTPRRRRRSRGLADDAALTSQVQLLLSRELALDVISKLKLTERPEFDPVLSGISPLKYALVTARHLAQSDAHDAGGAGARGLLRPADGVPGREVAGHRRSNSSRPIPSSRRASPTRSPTAISRCSRRPSRTRPAPPANGCPARSTSCAARSRRPRPRSRSSAPSPTCSSAPTTPRCRTSSSANSTPRSPPRARRRPTPRRARA